MLSAYLDGAVSAAQKSQIERHLEECSDCRNTLHELEKTIHHVRSLGEVEPPPWLAVKVMARVREEAGRKRGMLRRLLQVPLRWRIPVEAAALVFLSVTGYLVYRNVSSDMKQVVPLSGEFREEYASPDSLPAALPKTPGSPAPEQGKSSFVPMKKKRAEMPVPPARSTEPSSSAVREELSREPLPAAGAPVVAEEQKQNFRLQDRDDAKSSFPADRMPLPEQKAGAFSGLMRSKSLPPAAPEVFRIKIYVTDPDSVAADIEGATGQCGGVILRKDVQGGGEKIFTVRLQREAVPGYLKRLASLGDIRGALPTVPDTADAVEIRITVSGGR
jgi:hypothetical protein